MQYFPENGVYVYFRYDKSKTVMIATNSMDKEINLDTARFSERMKGFSGARNVLTNEIVSTGLIKLPAKTALVLELAR